MKEPVRASSRLAHLAPQPLALLEARPVEAVDPALLSAANLLARFEVVRATHLFIGCPLG